MNLPVEVVIQAKENNCQDIFSVSDSSSVTPLYTLGPSTTTVHLLFFFCPLLK